MCAKKSIKPEMNQILMPIYTRLFFKKIDKRLKKKSTCMRGSYINSPPWMSVVVWTAIVRNVTDLVLCS